jgi:hypothetical protein
MLKTSFKINKVDLDSLLEKNELGNRSLKVTFNEPVENI